jgi:hypothetical protein
VEILLALPIRANQSWRRFSSNPFVGDWLASRLVQEDAPTIECNGLNVAFAMVGAYNHHCPIVVGHENRFVDNAQAAPGSSNAA